MNAVDHLHLAGWLLLALAVLNIFVPRRFGWKAELAKISLLNRRIFEVHAFFIVLTLILFGLLLVTCAEALAEPTRLARAVLLGLTVFWSARLYMQLFYYDVALWRGKRFETFVHIVFSALWAYYVAVFGGTWWAGMG